MCSRAVQPGDRPDISIDDQLVSRALPTLLHPLLNACLNTCKRSRLSQGLERPFSIAWCRLGHKVWYPKCHKSLQLTWAGESAPSWVGSGTMQDPPPAV